MTFEGQARGRLGHRFFHAKRERAMQPVLDDFHVAFGQIAETGLNVIVDGVGYRAIARVL